MFSATASSDMVIVIRLDTIYADNSVQLRTPLRPVRFQCFPVPEPKKPQLPKLAQARIWRVQAKG